MPRGFSRPVATLVQAEGRPEALGSGVVLALGDDDGSVDAVELGRLLVVGLAPDDGLEVAAGPQAAVRRASVASPVRASRAPIAGRGKRIIRTPS
jgi:hypothetical protein